MQWTAAALAVLIRITLFRDSDVITNTSLKLARARGNHGDEL